MLKQLLSDLGAVHVSFMVGMLLDQWISASRRFLKKRVKPYRIMNNDGKDRISALSDDLLVKILLLVPTKDAIATMILSKRWRSIWTMVPKLQYRDHISDVDNSNKVVIGGLLGRLLERFFGKSDQQRRWSLRFIDESLQAHKAPVLERLGIELGPPCLVDDNLDVRKWITKAVGSRVRELGILLDWSAEPTSLPKSLYTCDTLVSLALYGKILLDVPSSAYLPSLKYLSLYFLVYKDDDSVVRLFSSCPILKNLIVERHYQDNVKNFSIVAPFLEGLSYDYVKFGAHGEGTSHGGTLVVDSLALKKTFITDYSGDTCSIENKPSLDKAKINFFSYPNNEFKRSLSSVVYLELILSYATLVWFNAINFTQLLKCKILFLDELDWLEPLMLLLEKSPNLKVLCIDQTYIQNEEELSLSWNQPCSVPGCLSTHLEIFQWKGYRGRREEKEIVRYILANSKSLKRAGVSMKSTCKGEDRKKMMKELKSMTRVSASSKLLFSTQVEYMNVLKELSD